jgi:molybdopterin-guanine dinucleotide biosynthesis protein MobB
MKTFGIVGWKNSGKTGLVERLVTEISLKGFSVSTIKHAHHTFDIDQMGKDSFRHRQAGAMEVLLSSENRWALMHELRDSSEPNLNELLSKLSPVDLVLIEGFKNEYGLKMEAYRIENNNIPLVQSANDIIALASNTTHPNLNLPIFDLDDTSEIANFILREVDLK